MFTLTLRNFFRGILDIDSPKSGVVSRPRVSWVVVTRVVLTLLIRILFPQSVFGLLCVSTPPSLWNERDWIVVVNL